MISLEIHSSHCHVTAKSFSLVCTRLQPDLQVRWTLIYTKDVPTTERADGEQVQYLSSVIVLPNGQRVGDIYNARIPNAGNDLFSR